MLIKAYAGDGSWTMWQADAHDLQFLGADQYVHVPDGEHDYAADERIPYYDNEMHGVLHVLHTQEAVATDSSSPDPYFLMRWVRWRSDEQVHTLVTNGSVYICNDNGKTIEVLR